MLLDNARTAVSGASKLRLVILDACRNNPFKLASADGKRSVGRGLSRVEPGSNELVAYAAREGTVASDGTGETNSPYAAALAKYLAEPGLEVRLLFGRVRDEVMSATSESREPFVYGSLGGEALYLNPPSAIVAAPDLSSGGNSTIPSGETQPKGPTEWETNAFQVAMESTNPDVIEGYLAEFPNGGYRKVIERHLQSVLVERSAFENAMRSRTAAAVAAFLGKYPQSPYRPRVEFHLGRLEKELAAYEAAMGSTDPVAIRQFIRDYPSSPERGAVVAHLNATIENQAPPKNLPILGSGWLVVLGSYPHSDFWKATERQAALARLGIDAKIVDTDEHPGLSGGLYAVVLGRMKRAEPNAAGRRESACGRCLYQTRSLAGRWYPSLGPSHRIRR